MIDSLMEFNEKFDNSSILQKLSLTNKEYALITLHRPSNVDDKNEMLKLMDALVETSELVEIFQWLNNNEIKEKLKVSTNFNFGPSIPFYLKLLKSIANPPD